MTFGTSYFEEVFDNVMSHLVSSDYVGSTNKTELLENIARKLKVIAVVIDSPCARYQDSDMLCITF